MYSILPNWSNRGDYRLSSYVHSKAAVGEATVSNCSITMISENSLIHSLPSPFLHLLGLEDKAFGNWLENYLSL